MMKTENLTLCAFALPLLTAVASAQESAPARSPITAALQPFVDSHALAGAVTLVTSKDATLDLQAVGFADVSARKPMRTNALFWIASQTKAMTAAALMMLADEGRLKLDDPVEKYLPEFHGQWLAAEQDDAHLLLRKPQHPITVRNILSHTSGLPFASSIEHPTLDGLPLREAVLSYALSPLQFEPGSKYQYSNEGINTAGRLIEVLSGMAYEAFLQKRLLDPLGMKDTTFWPNKSQLARLAKAYKPNAAGDGLEETTLTQLHYPLDDRKNRYPMPAGGLFSTAQDVGRFCQMLLNGGVWEGKRLLSEAAVEQMTRKQTGDAVSEGYGLGLSVNGDSYGHGGAYSTNMTVDRKHGLITVFLVQHAGFPKNGDQSGSAFRDAAEKQFGK